MLVKTSALLWVFWFCFALFECVVFHLVVFSIQLYLLLYLLISWDIPGSNYFYIFLFYVSISQEKQKL